MASRKYRKLSDSQLKSRYAAIDEAERKALQKYRVLSELEQAAFCEWSAYVDDQEAADHELRRRGLEVP